jgi:hypothetical protein
MTERLEKKLATFKNNFQVLDKESLHRLDQMYEPDIHFEDPLHIVNGLDELKSYFSNMYSNVQSIRFDFTHELVCGEEAVLFWTMHFIHPRLNKGATIEVNGSSHLKFRDYCYHHRDYFDTTDMLFEHIPLLGSVIRGIKKRIN